MRLRGRVIKRRGHKRLEVIVPSFWVEFYEETRVPAARRDADIVRLTGHTGETAGGVFSTDVETQVRQTFRNIGLTLTEAGVGWSDVVALTSYCVGLRQQAPVLIKVASEFLVEPYPVWTAVGVTELWDADAVVEISCVAIDSSASTHG